MKSYNHNTGSFIGKSGIEIFFQSWTVDSPKGILVIAHGHGEHSSRYDNIIKKLADLNLGSLNLGNTIRLIYQMPSTEAIAGVRHGEHQMIYLANMKAKP